MTECTWDMKPRGDGKLTGAG